MTGASPGSDPGALEDLRGQTVVLIGGSAGIGLETARLARARGADVILTGRNPDRLRDAATQVDARSTASFDVTDLARVEQFFEDLPGPVDHVMVTGGGPYYSTLADMDFAAARRDVGDRILVPLVLARYGAARMRAPGTLLFMGGTGGRRPGVGLTLISALTAALPALIASLAVEVAPVRVNLIAAGFVDTPLSASLLGDQLDARRAELRATLPIGRVVGPTDIAALAVHLMTNTALTGGTYDIDGGQQLVFGQGRS
jgi:NAD(P)-dependent dehydrogenase (short-subunit alcohol dehydrogenase family)